MIRTKQKGVRRLLTCSAMSVALSFAVAATAPVEAKETKAAAPKAQFSPAFAKAAAEFEKTLSGAPNNPAVMAASDKAKAAKTPQEKAAAAVEVDAALGGANAKLAEINAAATTPTDKLKAGDMNRIVGGLTGDLTLQHKGLVMMLESGGLSPEQTPQVQFFAGVTAYQSKDYAGAITYLKPAMDAGYHDQQGLLPQLLADCYKRTNNAAAASAVSQQELASAQASGAKPSETALRSALQSAYDAHQMGNATNLAVSLVQNYPSPSSWTSSIKVVRSLSSLPAQDNLDLMRLMARTNSMSDRADYLEYIQNADPRRLPGEVLKILNQGVSAAKLSASDAFVAESKATASGRISADKASLPGLERDARAPKATAATAAAAGDAFLSYDDAAKAEAMYAIALTKPGVDAPRVLTRLGIAQSDQGKYTEAQANFSKIEGPRKPVAQLWGAYVAQKAKGG
jgi:hypothetical protein